MADFRVSLQHVFEPWRNVTPVAQWVITNTLSSFSSSPPPEQFVHSAFRYSTPLGSHAEDTRHLPCDQLSCDWGKTWAVEGFIIFCYISHAQEVQPLKEKERKLSSDPEVLLELQVPPFDSLSANHSNFDSPSCQFEKYNNESLELKGTTHQCLVRKQWFNILIWFWTLIYAIHSHPNYKKMRLRFFLTVHIEFYIWRYYRLNFPVFPNFIYGCFIFLYMAELRD